MFAKCKNWSKGLTKMKAIVGLSCWVSRVSQGVILTTLVPAMTAPQACEIVAKYCYQRVLALISLFFLYKSLICSTPSFLVFITVSFFIGTTLFVLEIQLMLSIMLISAVVNLPRQSVIEK